MPSVDEVLVHPVFEAVTAAADELDVEAYVVGGYVRDAILGRPCKDIDIVSVGKGTDLALNVAERLGNRKVNVFKNFGTAQLVYNDSDIEFVGARKESYRADSRKPVVEDGTLEDDQKRRDFTINALAIGLNKQNRNKLLDPFNGLSDLDNRLIRTPLDPEITYSDDPLRMMRAIRFAAQLDFSIEQKSLDAIGRNRERIKIISGERIAEELNKIITADIPSVGFGLLFDTGLLQIIFPEMAALQGVQTVNGQSHKDNFYHTLQVVDNLSLKTRDLWLRWAAVLHDIAKPATKRFDTKAGWTFHGHEDRGAKMVPRIFAQLKLPLNDKMKYVQKLVYLHLRPIVLAQETVTDSAVRRLLMEAGNDIDDLMMLCEADITTKDSGKQKRYLRNFQLVRQKLKEVEEKDHLRNWQPPLSGKDIMECFNIAPSLQVGIIKEAIREAILAGTIQNRREDAYRFMIEKGKEMGLAPGAGSPAAGGEKQSPAEPLKGE
ncbi:MAG: HD domain-containing protein [Bacteroidia bacterium]|nr:HD domain-containing protein [Bacteroidia bacterium]